MFRGSDERHAELPFIAICTPMLVTVLADVMTRHFGVAHV